MVRPPTRQFVAEGMHFAVGSDCAASLFFFFKERRRFISIMVITKSLFLILQLPSQRPYEKYTPTPKVNGRQVTGNQQVKLLIPLTECRYPLLFFTHFEIFEVQF